MKKSAVVTIRIDVGSTETGVWCQTCLLPSAVVVRMVRLVDDGVSEFATWTGCTSCQPELFEERTQ